MERQKKMGAGTLIRSYIFVNLNNGKEHLTTLQTDGVVKFISFEGKAAAIPDKQIENIKLLLASEEELEVTSECFEKGMRVNVFLQDR